MAQAASHLPNRKELLGAYKMGGFYWQKDVWTKLEEQIISGKLTFPKEGQGVSPGRSPH